MSLFNVISTEARVKPGRSGEIPRGRKQKYRSAKIVFAPARFLDYARNDGAKYRNVRLSGGTRAPRPTEAKNDISNKYLSAAARRRADEERPYPFYQM